MISTLRGKPTSSTHRDILSEMLRSNLFLATGYRKWKHGEETSLEPINKLSYGS
jgi:hypothetical protein